ncbi:MAG: tRNA (adenosine(37)-N6)-threonylcarbamoyltransferase complex dimerization subunit type 1 TsaB [Clostridium sp.]|nr:tRNA (adenosine(37)-N6)-threonylcarbamoyltransferase complex dimerization subunit type 1 TsaB [Prevotella sp.]MCM1428791.1 tRNA (adenosine(37)-N6)-threonylcarbamoyltransferase complex dimerization subunit type 1 TsaB [Clostridium sp.]MCM1475166.1 tRNA (adenosine(37)-N6)-threonylcarbamoyltransferase complex dimerization subunit type 1 TsaB [Muribaculaceae bacterium]
MAIILNIETSADICSVALTKDGGVDFHIESDKGMKHAECLGPYIERCLDELARREEKLDAVAVSIGPGSYTGLRIGLSMAKGLCFSKQIPLIGVPTLKILAVKAMFSNSEWEGDDLLVPMIDARRMEVYTAVYNFRLDALMEPQPIILDENSYDKFFEEGKTLIGIGDGTIKARDVIVRPGIEWLGTKAPLALDMTALSELYYRKGEFLDLAYSTPEYLKEYQATLPKNKVLGDISTKPKC